jgi:hypothetical protein
MNVGFADVRGERIEQKGRVGADLVLYRADLAPCEDQKIAIRIDNFSNDHCRFLRDISRAENRNGFPWFPSAFRSKPLQQRESHHSLCFS